MWLLTGDKLRVQAWLKKNKINPVTWFHVLAPLGIRGFGPTRNTWVCCQGTPEVLKAAFEEKGFVPHGNRLDQ